MRTAWLQKVARAAPSRCAVCGAWPAHALCSACLERFARPQPRCRRCALPLPAAGLCGACLREAPPLAACYAAVSYQYPWASLVARFKFHGEPGWADSLATLVQAVPGVPEELAAADVVLPMPLAATRLAERGFNQAVQLARRLAPHKTETRLLLRLRETAVQASLDREARERNVRGAFGVDPLRVGELKGKAALLVDDVMTSGASLHAAARAVHAAGAARVSAVVLARTDAP